MAFLELERFEENNVQYIRAIRTFHLAGWRNGLLKRAWERKGKNKPPINDGWHVSRQELVHIHSDGKYDTSNRLLASLWNSKTKSGIGVVELMDVYGYTFGSDDNEAVWWTPLMLRVSEVFWQDLEEPMTESQKIRFLSNPRKELPSPQHESIEFLYLQGNWNWGPTGSVNAAFIHDGARKYFKQFF